MATKKQILTGRKAVDAYRKAHTLLHQKPYYRQIHDDHTPLLNKMVGTLKKQGFSSIQKFFDASEELNLTETGIYSHNVYRLRKDLEMLGTPNINDGVELQQTEAGRQLLIDGRPAMDTSVKEHTSMMLSVAECPPNARVFIGGLGIGLILLYLAESGRVREVTICELDERVINLLGLRITDYLAKEYPDFNLRIIQGDAVKRILVEGKFDWVFFDLPQPTPIELTQSALTERGIYTDWWSVFDKMNKGWWH